MADKDYMDFKMTKTTIRMLHCHKLDKSSSMCIFSICLDRTYMVFVICIAFCSFFFFFSTRFKDKIQLKRLLFMHSSRNFLLFRTSVDPMHCSQCMNSSQNFLLFRASVDPVHCSQDPQTSLFINFFIKNGSHGTIHAFKKYFATMFSVFSFSKNKLYPNEL